MSNIETQAERRIALVRVAVGLGQGLSLYGLSRCFPKFEGVGFSVVLALAVTLPVIALGGLGALKARTLTIWLAGAGIVVGGLTWHQSAHADPPGHGLFPSGPFAVVTIAGLFIVHALILGAAAEGRRIASYERYFDVAWKDAVRLALSAAFVGALWAVLGLGAGLFDLIGITLVRNVITKPIFIFPATATFFALAAHATDVRAGLVRGVRTLALTLLSWLLPVMTLLAVAFLATLPFIGLKPLWATRNAAVILLAAAAALIVLINAAYQDGAGERAPPRLLKWTVRIAAVAVAPLVAIAAYGVMLRVGQYGLTPERVFSMACLMVGFAYAIGYLAAVFRPGPWMKRLEAANIGVAFLVPLLLIALFSPLADPARLSVEDQVARLKAGRIAPEAFDYGFLRFHAGRYGQDALAGLVARPPSPVVGRLAAQAQKRTNPYQEPVLSAEEKAKSVVVAGGGALPNGFLTQDWTGQVDPFASCRPEAECAAIVQDLDGDGVAEVIAMVSSNRSVFHKVGEHWELAGALAGAYCGGDAAAVRAGKFALAPPDHAWSDVLVDGRRLRVVPADRCVPRPERLTQGEVADDVTDVAIVKPAAR